MCHKKIKRPADLSIEEGTLSAALFRVKQRCGKVDDFLHFLPFAKEHGLWIPIDSVFDLGTPGPSGNENDTYVSNDIIYKVNNL